jgi:hypothetical protein
MRIVKAIPLSVHVENEIIARASTAGGAAG